MLINSEDLQSSLNIDLTNPNGVQLAETLTLAVQGVFSTLLGFPIEQTQVTEYRSDGQSLIHLDTTAPVSALTVSLLNSSTNDYDTLASTYVTHHGGRQVSINHAVPERFHALRLAYTTGWTAETLPLDLKQALIETVGLKLQSINNYSSQPPGTEEEGESASTPQLKRVSTGSYTEEYANPQSDAWWKARAAHLTHTIGEDLPASIRDTVLAYRPAYAL